MHILSPVTSTCRFKKNGKDHTMIWNGEPVKICLPMIK